MKLLIPSTILENHFTIQGRHNYYDWASGSEPTYSHTTGLNFLYIQVNELGHIRIIVEKAKETSSDTVMHNRAITVLHT